MSKHKKRPGAKRRWLKHPFRSRGADGTGGTTDEAAAPPSRLARLGLSVLRRITARVLPLTQRPGFERVSDRLARASDRFAHLRDDVRKKLDRVTATARRGSSTTA